MPPALTWTDAAGAAALASREPSGVVPFQGFTPATEMVGVQEVALGSRIIYAYEYAAPDQSAAFAVPLLKPGDYPLFSRLLLHLARGGEVRCWTSDRAGRSYRCGLKPGTVPQWAVADAQTLDCTATVVLLNREPTNLLALLAGISLTLLTGGGGVAAGWASGGAVTGFAPAFGLDPDGQQIAAAGNTSGGTQFGSVTVVTAAASVAPGDVLTLAADYRTASLAGGAAGHLALHFLDAAGTTITGQSDAAGLASVPFARASVTGTAPAGTSRARAFLALSAPNGGGGQVWWRNAQLARAAAATDFDAGTDPGPLVAVYGNL